MNSRSSFKSVPFTTFSFRRLACSNLHLIVGFLALSIICLAAPGLALSQSTPSARPDAAAEQQTQSLVAQLARYQKAGPAEQAQHLKDLITLAAERRQLLSSLIEENPGAVLRVALPKRLRTSMPDAVQDYLEQRVELEGELVVLDEDYEDFHRLRYFLKANGKRYSLHFAARPSKLLTGAQVRVSGTQIDGAMVLESGETSVQFLTEDGADSGSSSGTTAAELANTLGEQRTLVLLVNFRDQPEEPWTVEEARSLVFGTVSEFFLENSNGQTWLAGDVCGWYTTSVESTDCNSYQIEIDANAAASANGIDLSAYDRFIYVFPENTDCGWSGMAKIGGNPSKCWINGSFVPKVVGHELGHNFGLFHSHALECGDTTLGIDSQTFEYGDTMDIMGNKSAGHFNAFQKERLGWLGYGDSPPISAIEIDGTYMLETYEGAVNTEPKAVKILKGIDPTTGQKSWYYVEYRQAIGFDSFLLDDPYIQADNVLNGVVIHMATETDPNSSFLLDMTPASSTHYDWTDPALVMGETYSDPETGMIITVDRADDYGASVSVRHGEPICMPANPSLVFSPSESQWVEPGTPVSYTVTVTNHDSAGCAPALFELKATVPDGWTTVFGEAALTLEPGASASTTLVVTSLALTPDEFYSVAVTAQNSANINYTASASTTYVVSSAGGDTVAPIVAITSPQDGASILSRITIQASASDDSGISRIELYVNGTLKVVKYKSALSWNWNTRKERDGEHTILVKAFDTAENEGIETVTVSK